MKFNRLIIPVFLLFIPLCISAQTIDSLYKRADSFRDQYAAKYYYGISAIDAIEKTDLFWYLTQTPRGMEFRIIDVTGKKTSSAFDQQRVASLLSDFKDLNKIEPYNLPFRSVIFNQSVDTLKFRVENFDYTIALKEYSISREPVRNDQNRYWGSVQRENSNRKVKSPDGKREAYISEGNLWVTDLATEVSKQLSYDGTDYEYYSSDIIWSPDSKKLVSCRYRPGGDRKLLLISSSPKNQLQPLTYSYDYPKPGDALPIRRPVLFIPDEDKQITFDVPNVEQQYSLGRIDWDENSEYFTFHFNRRGHQQYVVYSGDINGRLYPIVDERADTFIYYNKISANWLKKGKELLWVSERDGWSHLYLYDVPSGKVKKQITSGEWVVKDVIHVDEDNRTVIIKACGMDKNEDPYLEKYYKVSLDNEKLTALTPENANHSVTFSSDYKYMVDSYSRVDLKPDRKSVV